MVLISPVSGAEARKTPAHTHAPTVQDEPPTYTVDPNWPKPLPNGWKFGNVVTVVVDSRDHIWLLHRPGEGIGSYGIGPPVMEFDFEGNLIQAWGGPGRGYQWPESEHGLAVDDNGNVWVTGNGGSDDQLLKFTRDGKFLLQIGRSGESRGNGDKKNLGSPADAYVVTKDREIYVADGYGNRRVVVFDSKTGAYKRRWGAYGNVPKDGDTDPDRQFGSPVHGIKVSKDGLVYVADRPNSRVQVFRKNGTFVKEFTVPDGPLGQPAAFDVSFIDPEQKFMLFADGFFPGTFGNDRILILRRGSGKIVGQIGGPGIRPGQFNALHTLDTDSKGNLFTGELLGGQGGRAQKFVLSD